MERPPRRSLCRRKVEVSQPAREEAKNNYAQFPEELLEIILAGLTLPELAISLPCLSKSWQTRMFAKSSSLESRAFRKLLDEKHPKMIAIVGMERRFQLTVATFDFASGQWHDRVLGHLLDDTDEHRRLKSGYVNQACFAHDAGLLCFVFSGPRKACPVVLCNPLTNEWKALPLQECNERVSPVLVQLVVDDTTGHYKVTVVYKHRRNMTGKNRGLWSEWYEAELYDSMTKLWSPKKDGMAYGQELYYSQLHARYHNCDGGEWFEPERLSLIASLCPEQSEANFLTARDGMQRMFKLKQEPGEDTYRISESVTEYVVRDITVATIVREADSYRSSLPVVLSGLNDVYLMDTSRFLFLLVDQYLSKERVHRQQTMRVRDQVTGEWYEIPAPTREFRIPLKSKYFMCELRWNAIPDP